MSFANQFLSLKALHEEPERRPTAVHDLSEEQDQDIAGLKLETMAKSIDTLTPEQIAYMNDYSAGT
jgi:adenosylhomocysteinase